MKRRVIASLPALLLAQPALSTSAALAGAGGQDGPATAGGRDGPATAAGAPGGGAGARPDTGVAPVAELSEAADPAAFESPGVVQLNLPAFYERLRAELTFPGAWGNSPIRDLAAWRRSARATVEEALQQPAEHTDLDPLVVDERTDQGYVQRILVFNVTRHSRVRATMLLPPGRGPFPAVLLLHDHGSRFDIGKEKLIRPWYDDARLASALEWADRCFEGRFVGDELVARGYAVLCVDALGWGDRGGLAYADQQALASNFFNLGGSLAGLLAREDVRAAQLLAGLPEVDRSRIAAVGFSMGAYRAWQVAALSEHIRVGAAVCWMTTLAEMMVPGNNTLRGQSAFHMLHPGLYRHLDIPDVASIAAPKPMLFFNGELDSLFPVAGVRAAYEKMRAVWRAHRAGDRLSTHLWPERGHIFDAQMQREAFDWLDGWLRPR